MNEEEANKLINKIKGWHEKTVSMMGFDFNPPMMCSLMSTTMVDLARVFPDKKDEIVFVMVVTAMLIDGRPLNEFVETVRDKCQTVH